MKKIAFKEDFYLYAHVDFKEADRLVSALQSSGFQADSKPCRQNDDHKVRVLVNPFNSYLAAGVIDQFLNP